METEPALPFFFLAFKFAFLFFFFLFVHVFNVMFGRIDCLTPPCFSRHSPDFDDPSFRRLYRLQNFFSPLHKSHAIEVSSPFFSLQKLMDSSLPQALFWGEDPVASASLPSFSSSSAPVARTVSWIFFVLDGCLRTNLSSFFGWILKTLVQPSIAASTGPGFLFHLAPPELNIATS